MIGLRPRDLPPVLREHRTVRALLLPGMLACSIAKVATSLPAELVAVGSSRGEAAYVTVATVAAGLVTLVCLAWWALTHQFTEVAPPDSPLLAVSFALPVSVAFGLALRSSFAVPRSEALAAAGACAGAVFAGTRELLSMRRGSRAHQTMSYNRSWSRNAAHN